MLIDGIIDDKVIEIKTGKKDAKAGELQSFEIFLKNLGFTDQLALANKCFLIAPCGYKFMYFLEDDWRDDVDNKYPPILKIAVCFQDTLNIRDHINICYRLLTSGVFAKDEDRVERIGAHIRKLNELFDLIQF